MPITAGTRLGRYEIRSQLGAGGMGEVYLAQDTKLRRPVALKLLPAEFSRSSGWIVQFQPTRAGTGLSSNPTDDRA